MKNRSYYFSSEAVSKVPPIEVRV